MTAPNRFEKRKQRTRNQLKTCALDLLLEKGYIDLTIQDITDCADFARGTFYVHFADKDDIVWAIVHDSMESLVETSLAGVQDVPYARQKIITWVNVFTYAHDNRALLQVLLGEKGHPAFAQRLQDFVGGIIEQGIESGVFRPQMEVELPTPFVAQYMTGALVRLMLWSLDTDYTPEQLAQMFYEVIYREPMPPELGMGEDSGGGR